MDTQNDKRCAIMSFYCLTQLTWQMLEITPVQWFLLIVTVSYSTHFCKKKLLLLKIRAMMSFFIVLLNFALLLVTRICKKESGPAVVVNRRQLYLTPMHSWWSGGQYFSFHNTSQTNIIATLQINIIDIEMLNIRWACGSNLFTISPKLMSNMRWAYGSNISF